MLGRAGVLRLGLANTRAGPCPPELGAQQLGVELKDLHSYNFLRWVMPWLVWTPHFENHCPKGRGSWVTRGRHFLPSLEMRADRGSRGSLQDPGRPAVVTQPPLLCRALWASAPGYDE